MAKDNWDENQIEQLLREFPKIEDRRPKEEVYKRLKKNTEKPKSPKRWLPAAVAALAFVTLAVLLASLIGQPGTDHTSESGISEDGSQPAKEEAAGSDSATEESASPEQAETAARPEDGASESQSAAFQTEEAGTDAAQDGQTAVYPADLKNHVLFVAGLTENAYVVPVSFLIPKSEAEETAEPDAVSLYNRFADEIDETGLGFDEYHPYEGEIRTGGGGVIHQLPQDHPYDLSSASSYVYSKSLEQTFREAGTVTVTGADGEPAEFDAIGVFEPVSTDPAPSAYYLFETAGGETYVAPDYEASYASAEEALTGLSQPPSDLLKSPVPEGASYSVAEDADAATLSFSEPLDLNQLGEQAASQLIESLSLTAGSYGKQLRLENIQPEQWNGFDFSEPLKEPLSPNKQVWPEE